MVSIRGSTTRDQIRDFERQMQSVAREKIPRAVQFALNGVAIDASKKMQAMLPTVLDEPTLWIQKAFVAKKGATTVTDLKDVKASLESKPEQSALLKFYYGDGDETERLAGDIGPAERMTLIPIWPNIKRRSKVKPTKQGNLPRTALGSLFTGKGIRGGVFWGSPTVMGQRMAYGLWARPSVRGQGLPSMLLKAVDSTKHPDLLTEPTRRVAEAAMATLSNRLEAELRSQLARQAGRASAASRGVGGGAR